MADVKIIFEDSDILVLDKPAGMTVNRSDTSRNEKTLQDFVEEKLKIKNEELQIQDGDFRARSGIVHRLDKETSGIILVAKNEEVFSKLQRQFKEREVKKTYTALVHGKVAPAEGEIIVPVGRLPWNRKRFGVVAGGKDAVTGYKVLRYYKMKSEALTLLELSPKTGRTHQIRVHLKYTNHPVFADILYGGRKTARQDRKVLSRQFLHASEIKFQHPINHAPLSFESPLPQELQALLDTLNAF